MDAARKRQRIILSAAALAVLYVLYSLTLGSGMKNTAATAKMRAEELQVFITQTTEKIAKGVPLSFDAYIITRAGSKWDHNPFSGKAGAFKGTATEQPLFVYTGYIETGGRRLAIINDMEYQTGDRLEKEDYFVKKISSSRVLIGNKKEKTEFEIPLFE